MIPAKVSLIKKDDTPLNMGYVLFINNVDVSNYVSKVKLVVNAGNIPMCEVTFPCIVQEINIPAEIKSIILNEGDNND